MTTEPTATTEADAALEAALEKATAGEWGVEVETDTDDEPEVYVIHPGTVCTASIVAAMGNATGETERRLADAAAITLAINWLRAGGLARARRADELAAEVVRLRSNLQWLADDPDLPRPFRTYCRDTLAVAAQVRP